MAFKKRRIAGLTAAAPQDLGNVSLGAKYGKVHGFRARNYASSAMAGAGTDTACKVSLTDANGDVFYLDASDRDYATAEVTIFIATDDTATGLGVTPVDATGAAATAGAGGVPVVQGPINVDILNGGTATDYFVLDLLVEV
jgi:hypothetical protein